MSAREWVALPGKDAPTYLHVRNDNCEVRGCLPRVVIDPNEIPHLGEFGSNPVDALREIADNVRDIAGGDLDATEAVIRWLADLMPQSPRPDEPTGLGAVVIDATGERYVLTSTARKRGWTPAGSTNRVQWCEIDADPVRILSAGVES